MAASVNLICLHQIVSQRVGSPKLKENKAFGNLPLMLSGHAESSDLPRFCNIIFLGTEYKFVLWC